MEDKPTVTGGLTSEPPGDEDKVKVAEKSALGSALRKWRADRKAQKQPIAPVDPPTAEPTEDVAEADQDKTERAEPEAEPEADVAEAAAPVAQRGRAHRMPVGKARKFLTPPAESTPEPTADAVDVADAEVTEVEGVDAVEADDHEAPESVTLVERKPAGKRLKVAAVAASVAFVAAGVFAGATAQPYLADRALVATKLNIAETAVNAITALWTYTPADMDALPDRAASYLSGDFESAYRTYVDGIAAMNKQAQVSNDTQVLGAAVESVTASDASAIVYTNSTATSPVTKNVPSLRYLSYRLALTHRDDRWLVTKMTTITSLDLTPQL